jgi:hypothetical protein
MKTPIPYLDPNEHGQLAVHLQEVKTSEAKGAKTIITSEWLPFLQWQAPLMDAVSGAQMPGAVTRAGTQANLLKDGALDPAVVGAFFAAYLALVAELRTKAGLPKPDLIPGDTVTSPSGDGEVLADLGSHVVVKVGEKKELHERASVEKRK